jgi:hypothetical protein
MRSPEALSAASRALALSLVLLGGSVEVATAQSGGEHDDAYLDPTAREVHLSAQRKWREVDDFIVRYSALIRQRIAASLRTPLKDRTLYRNETAVRAFWDRDYEPIVQVLGTRSQYPGRDRAIQEGMGWLEDLPFDEPFDPAGDRLFFGLGSEDDTFEADEADFWIAHPLAQGADSLYQFRSGDTLTLALPDGRSLRTVQLDVLPREADVHRISGTLWIEPGSGSLVQAVYRLSQQFDAVRDIPELRAEEAAGSFRYVPGLFKPWTFDMTLVAVEYGLWDFEIWLPRAMRVEGQAAAGILKFPVSTDVSYRIESVTTVDDLAEEREAVAAAAAGTPRSLTDRHFASRAEAMAFIAELLSDRDGVAYEPLSADGSGRNSYLLAPSDPRLVATSPELPPPIWEDASGFASEAELSEMVGALSDLPMPPVDGVPWSASWGFQRHDLVRYNRVEGPSIGGRFQAELGAPVVGPLTMTATGFVGLADVQPKARIDVQRASVRRRIDLGVYREVQATDPMGRFLQAGNSANAFLFGRDDGEYYLATGADLRIRPVESARQWWMVRGYAERHHAMGNKVEFSLFNAFEGGWAFRPNVAANAAEEAGLEVRLSPWWGTDPLLPQVGLELYGQGARWRAPRSEGAERDYARAAATLRVAIPLAGGNWRVGVEGSAGTTWGVGPVQRWWFLGGPRTLRGYGASTTAGSSYLRGRMEVARSYEFSTLSVFGDMGWAGARELLDSGDFLYGAGVGASFLDGLIRFDLSHGITGPNPSFRADLYLDAIL